MAKPIIDLELASKVNGRNRYAELSLPATDYELLDTLEILQVRDDKNISVYSKEYHAFPCLIPYLQDCGGLFGLNALTRELSGLDDSQSVAFAGLLKMEERKREPIRLPRLLALAVSAGSDCCHVINVSDDAELGRFYADNGFLPELDDLPDSVYDKLDFAQFGKEAREEEHGELIRPTGISPGGYVVRHSDLAPDVEVQDLAPRKPDYAILLELRQDGPGVSVSLPADPGEVEQKLGWDGVEVACLDCRVPALREAIERADDLPAVNRLALELAGMSGKQAGMFKAVVEATQCADVDGAIQLARRLDEFILSPQIMDPEDMARENLKVILDSETAEVLIPHLNLYAYGQALIRQEGTVLTSYGSLDRKDGQPVLAQTDSPRQGGVEMTQYI